MAEQTINAFRDHGIAFDRDTDGDIRRNTNLDTENAPNFRKNMLDRSRKRDMWLAGQKIAAPERSRAGVSLPGKQVADHQSRVSSFWHDRLIKLRSQASLACIYAEKSATVWVPAMCAPGMI